MYKTTLKLKHSRFPSDFMRHSTKYDWVDILIQSNESKILQIHMIIFQWESPEHRWFAQYMVENDRRISLLSACQFIHQLVIFITSWVHSPNCHYPHEFIHQLVIITSWVHSPAYYELKSSFTNLLLSAHEFIHWLVISSWVHSPTCFYHLMSSFINLLLSLMSSFTNRPMAV